MKVIFVQDVHGRGKRGGARNVPDGYAQNCLIKRGLAKEANRGNLNILKQVEANKKTVYEAEKADTIKIKKQLEGSNTIVQFESKAGTDGHLFGPASKKKIVEGLKQQSGLKIDKRKLELPEPTKALGCTSIKVKSFKGVEPTIRARITEEQDSI